MLTVRVFAFILLASPFVGGALPVEFFEAQCYDCHDSTEQKGDLDLAALKPDFANPDTFARWVKVFDRIESGEMPPKKKARPAKEEVSAVMKELHDSLVSAEQARMKEQVRAGVRRMTRAEYENTMRDLFDMPGIALAGELPPDGSAHGFDKNSDALDISHVNVAKFVEATEHTLDLAIATQPQPPTVQSSASRSVSRAASSRTSCSMATACS